MNWQEVLSILVPLIALMGWVYTRIEKKADERLKLIDEKFKLVIDELKLINEKIHSLDIRLTKLEGRFEERGYWESREWYKTGTENTPTTRTIIRGPKYPEDIVQK